MNMTTAEILTIGTEILLGEIVDTNTRHLPRKLREQGIDLYSQTIVGDNVDRPSGIAFCVPTSSSLVVA